MNIKTKLRALAVMVLMTLGALTTSAFAQGMATMACAQQGLLDKGFDPNGVDGQFGNGTRVASQAYLDANPDSTLPPLSNDEAIAGQWCNELGAHAIVLASEEIPIEEEFTFLFYLLDSRNEAFGDRQEYRIMDVGGEPQRVLIYEASVTEKLKGACWIIPNDMWTGADLGAGDACSGINTRPFYGEGPSSNGLYIFKYPYSLSSETAEDEE